MESKIEDQDAYSQEDGQKKTDEEQITGSREDEEKKTSDSHDFEDATGESADTCSDDEMDFLVGEKEFKQEVERLRECLEELQDSIHALRTSVNETGMGLRTVKGELASLQNTVVSTSTSEKSVEEKKQDLKQAKRMAKDLEKVIEKVNLMMEEVGYGEEIDVSKIPPNILEIVFQSTLDEVVEKIWKEKGSHDAERIIGSVLEEVRLRTSGSELFMFDAKRIKTRNLARTLEKELISARQIQTTYKELLGRLLEHLPGYKPKNFRAMIKIKSQEYSVDTSTMLTRKTTDMSGRLNEIGRRVEELTATVHGLSMDVHKKMEAMGEKLQQEQARVFEKQRAHFEDTPVSYTHLTLPTKRIV